MTIFSLSNAGVKRQRAMSRRFYVSDRIRMLRVKAPDFAYYVVVHTVYILEFPHLAVLFVLQKAGVF